VIEALSKVHLVNTDMKSDSTGAGRILSDEDMYHNTDNSYGEGDKRLLKK
jgi:hypothetical protein